MATLLVYGIWPRNPLIISSTCSAFRGYFSETSHALYQAPLLARKESVTCVLTVFPVFFEGEIDQSQAL